MKKLFSIFVAFFLSIASYAQWSGNLDLGGGTNFSGSNNENAAFKVKYSGKRTYVGLNLAGSHNYMPSEQQTTIIDVKKEGNEYYKAEDKIIKPRNWDARAGVDFGYALDTLNAIDVSVSYSIRSGNEFVRLSTERREGLSREGITGIQEDSVANKSGQIDGIIAYTRKFKNRPSAVFSAGGVYYGKSNLERKMRFTDGNFYLKHKHYATYSNLNDIDFKLNIAYNDMFNFNGSKIKLSAGIDSPLNNDVDGYAAESFVGGAWKDSTDYRQSYYYFSWAAEPYVNLVWTVGKFDFSLKERIQWYSHSMMDKLDEKKSRSDIKYLFDKEDWQNILAAGVKFRINERHSMSLDYARTISRPDYKKLCPTYMIGESEGEYFRGNPELKPEISDNVNFNYSYIRSIFNLSLDFHYRNKTNTAEKVMDVNFDPSTTDLGVKTLFTWINNKRQESKGVKLDLKMNGNDIKAEIWTAFNNDVYGNNKEFNKEDFNYELGSRINVYLNQSIKLSSDLIYVSAKESAYNLKGEDVIANLRFTKTFANGLELFGEFRDIVDKENHEQTWNQELTYLKDVVTKPMQRALLLGLSYRF